HPLLARLGDLRPNAEEARKRGTDPALVLALPGSRRSEITRLSRIFGEALGMVGARRGNLNIVLPTLPQLADEIADLTNTWPVRPSMVTTQSENNRAFRRARAALAASGTVTLELALAGVPSVAAYRIPPIEGFILRQITQVHPAVGVHSVILAN